MTCGFGLMIASIVLTVITVLSITGRFWSRSLVALEPGQTGKYWWDDWTALGTAAMILARFGILYYLFSIGLTEHYGQTDETITAIKRFIFVTYFFYSAAVFLARASALFFLNRIFPRRVNTCWFNLGVTIAHVLNVLWYIGIFLTNMLMCSPMKKFWDEMKPGTCVQDEVVWIANSSTSVFIDLIILCLPLPKIWALHTSKSRKAGLFVVFALGYWFLARQLTQRLRSAIVVSIGRLVTTLAPTPHYAKGIRIYGINRLLHWINAEPPVLLLSVCLPAMLPLARHFKKKCISPLASSFSTLLTSSSRKATLGSGTTELGDSTQLSSIDRWDKKQSDAANSSDLSYAHPDSSRIAQPTQMC